MACADCGRRCDGRLCRDCERDRYWEQRIARDHEADAAPDDGGDEA